MIKRSIIIGINAGLALVLIALYPVISLVIPVVYPAWQGAIQNELLHGILLMISASLGIVALVFGMVAARRAQAENSLQGAVSGAIAGISVGLILWAGLAVPINALDALGGLVKYRPELVLHLPPMEDLVTYSTKILDRTADLFWITVAIFTVLGALEGLLASIFLRPVEKSPRKEPFKLLKAGKHPRKWFAEDETSIIVALVVGGIMALMIRVIQFNATYLWFVDRVPELEDVLWERLRVPLIADPVGHFRSFLSPVVIFSLLFFGGLVVLLIKNPRNRFLDRITAVMVATDVIIMGLITFILRSFYLGFGLAPYEIHHQLQRGALHLTDPMIAYLPGLLRQPSVVVGVTLLTPWFFFILLASILGVIGFVQGTIYSFLVASFHKTPVDRAAFLWHMLKQEPAETLPTIYALFNNTPKVYAILAHLSVQAHQENPDIALLASCFHLLGTSDQPEDYPEAIEAIQHVLGDHPEWRWSADVKTAYHALGQVLSVRTLDQILAMSPPDELQTVSLPPFFLKTVQLFRRIVGELVKVKKVDDLQTRLIFLQNALDAINVAQQQVEHHRNECRRGRGTPIPALPVVIVALRHWQGVVLGATRLLKGRADLSFACKNTKTPYVSRLPLVCEVTNKGLNVAQSISVRVVPSKAYDLLDEGQVEVEILPPGETRQVRLTVAPSEGVRRMRVEWELTYDDAVDEQRNLSFADIIEFTDLDKPFQRIFPIPYVTGTPLKTDDVFVGREDIFKFVNENLVGSHQNNVIILHGQRRTGKTSVLYRLKDVMKESHYSVLIDMQGKPAHSAADFLFSIADDIIFELEDHGIMMDLPSRAVFEDSPEFYFRSRFLRQLRKHLNGKNMLLMFDEFEELQRRVEDGYLHPEIFQFLRNLMQHEDSVDFLFSGTHKLEELGVEYWSILFNIAVYKRITFLSEQDVRHLIDAPVAGTNLEYDPLSIESIIKVTAGHPYFTQLVLHEMVAHHNQNRNSYLTVADVDQVLERIVERGEAHFKYIWSEATPDEREVLRGLTELLVSDDAASGDDLRALLKKRGYDSEDDWERALTDLGHRDIITHRSVRHPRYRFKVDLVRLWIEKTRPAL